MHELLSDDRRVRVAFAMLFARRRRQEYWRQKCVDTMSVIETATGLTRDEVECRYGEWLQAMRERGGV